MIMVILVVILLATVILRIISSQARLTHHQLSRIKAYYAAKAGMNLALDNLRTGTWTQHATARNYYCINDHVDASVSCLATIADTKIPYNVQIAVYPKSQPGIDNTVKIETKVDYTYTP